jgi:hypothetical protein
VVKLQSEQHVWELKQGQKWLSQQELVKRQPLAQLPKYLLFEFFLRHRYQLRESGQLPNLEPACELAVLHTLHPVMLLG